MKKKYRIISLIITTISIIGVSVSCVGIVKVRQRRFSKLSVDYYRKFDAAITITSRPGKFDRIHFPNNERGRELEAEYLRKLHANWTSADEAKTIELEKKAKYYKRLHDKYAFAAEFPWLPIIIDSPETE